MSNMAVKRLQMLLASCKYLDNKANIFKQMGGRHSTAVAFTLHAQPARVRITAPENCSDIAVLIDSKDSAEKA